MGKGVQVKYHSFDKDMTETVHDTIVYRVDCLTIPTTAGDINYVVFGINPEVKPFEDGYDNYTTVFVPIDEYNFIELNGKSYPLRTVNDHNFLLNDLQTELDLINIDCKEK